jgi:hypothetical protein
MPQRLPVHGLFDHCGGAVMLTHALFLFVHPLVWLRLFFILYGAVSTAVGCSNSIKDKSFGRLITTKGWLSELKQSLGKRGWEDAKKSAPTCGGALEK